MKNKCGVNITSTMKGDLFRFSFWIKENVIGVSGSHLI